MSGVQLLNCVLSLTFYSFCFFVVIFGEILCICSLRSCMCIFVFQTERIRSKKTDWSRLVCRLWNFNKLWNRMSTNSRKELMACFKSAFQGSKRVLLRWTSHRVQMCSLKLKVHDSHFVSHCSPHFSLVWEDLFTQLTRGTIAWLDWEFCQDIREQPYSCDF